MDVVARHNITVSGPPDGQPMLFAHGFGCDQNTWRHIAPQFADRYRVILFDHLGAGDSDIASYDVKRHSTLNGYAQDVLSICRELELRDVVFVGHSVSSMIGALAAAEAPELFSRLVMVGPSPRYVDDGDYVGGFSAEDIDDLLDSLASNYLGWSAAMAPAIMGHPENPALGQELTDLFCRTDPEIARRFARVTFLSDNRKDLERVTVPTLVLQCSNDVVAPVSVGEFVARTMPDATLVMLHATGHVPNLSAPQETADAIEQYLVRAGTA